MDQNQKYVFTNLENKSNAIVAFIVIQSLLLTDRFSNSEFRFNVAKIEYIWNYIIYGHGLLILFSIVFLLAIHKKMIYQADDLQYDIYLLPSTIIKICLVLFFGILPLMVMLRV